MSDYLRLLHRLLLYSTTYYRRLLWQIIFVFYTERMQTGDADLQCAPWRGWSSTHHKYLTSWLYKSSKLKNLHRMAIAIFICRYIDSFPNGDALRNLPFCQWSIHRSGQKLGCWGPNCNQSTPRTRARHSPSIDILVLFWSTVPSMVPMSWPLSR